MSLPADISHLLFLDLETTSEATSNTTSDSTSNILLDPEREIIGFPCYLVQVRDSGGRKTWRVTGKFHEFVRPVRNPTLSSHCTDTTGISQWQVDAADPFPVVFERFTAWLRKHHDLKPESSLFVVDDGWELGGLLKSHLDRFGMAAPTDTVPFDKWLDVKAAFVRHRSGLRSSLYYPRTNLTQMLTDLGLKDNNKLRTTETARNIMRVYRHLDDIGCNTFQSSIVE